MKELDQRVLPVVTYGVKTLTLIRNTVTKTWKGKVQNVEIKRRAREIDAIHRTVSIVRITKL